MSAFPTTRCQNSRQEEDAGEKDLENNIQKHFPKRIERSADHTSGLREES
jgi:hypothetical protein